MTDKTSANLAKVRAEKFGENLSEALDIMIDFSLENKFDCYSIEEQNQLERVLEILTDCFDMWIKVRLF